MKMPVRSVLPVLFAWAAACAPVAHAAGAHEHGVVKLDVAVEGSRVVIEIDSPLDNLLGFEHAPRSDAEREKAEAMLKKLRDAPQLFRIDGNAGCALGTVDLRSAPLQLGKKPAAANDTHGDLEGSFEFKCKAGAKAAFLEVGLFDAFPQIKRIDLQVATPKGQMKATLRRPSTRVMLVR
jgi:Protein of unknown function (DUF2796)